MRLAGDIAINRHRGLAQLDLGQGLGQAGLCRLHERRVIRPGHRQRDRALGPGRLGRLAGGVHFVGITGDDDLPGTVEIGQAHAGLFADCAHRLLIETDDCRHPAGAGLACLLHQLAATPYHAQAILKGNRIRCGQRSELAQRQTGRGLK